MLKTKVRIEGTAELRRLLKALPEQLEKKVLVDASREVGRAVLKDFKAVAPRGSEFDRSPASTRYGHLFDNLRVKRPRRLLGIIVYSKDAFWTQWYEFGRRNQPARPTFRPVWDTNVDRYTDLYLRALGKHLERTAQKLAGQYKTARRLLGVRGR